jgi:iron complex outermembrane receptor protein
MSWTDRGIMMSFAPNATPALARTLLIGASLATLAFAGIARAEAPAADAPAAVPADVESEILVTATRRAENQKDVPVAVSVIGGEKLDVLNSSGLDIRFLSSRVPSLQIESSFGRTFPRFYIRGLGNTDYDPNAIQPVSVVYDDVALENPMLKSFPVFDLASVEVLKGPQGTLFGRNTPAGVVKLNSQAPTDTLGGYAQVAAGTYGTVNAEGAFNGPLGNGFDLRVSGLLQRRDNWVHNTDTSTPFVGQRNLEGYNDMAGRIQLGYTDGDFHALLNVHGRDLVGTPRLFRAGLFEQGSNHFNPGFQPDKVALDGYTSQTLQQYGTNLHLDYHFEGLGTLYSITSYEHARVESTGDIDGGDEYTFFATPPLGLSQAQFPDETGGVTKPREFSQELRFQTEQLGNFRFQGGGYYFHQKLAYSEYDYACDNIAGTGCYSTRTQDRDQDIEHRDTASNYGIFASGEYKLDKLTLRAGVRYSHDTKHDVIYGYSSGLSAAYVVPGSATFSGACALIAGGCPVLAPQSRRAKGSDVTWDASATYALSDQVNLYTRVATGYQAPAISDRATFGSTQSVAGKETNISAEAGIKGDMMDHAFTFSLDGYWYRVRNYQLTYVGGVGNTATVIPAKHVVGYGVEAELTARPTEALTLTAGGSYNYTQIRSPGLAVTPCTSGVCTPTDPTVGGLSVIDGNPLPQAPRYIANATLRYDVPLANGDKVFFYTDWAYRSSINYFLYEAKEFKGRPLTEGGLKLGYDHKNWEASVYVRNVLNQIRAISAIDFDDNLGMINDPRTVMGEVRFKF